jgi:hypothetical protein
MTRSLLQTGHILGFTVLLPYFFHPGPGKL